MEARRRHPRVIPGDTVMDTAAQWVTLGVRALLSAVEHGLVSTAIAAARAELDRYERDAATPEERKRLCEAWPSFAEFAAAKKEDGG